MYNNNLSFGKDGKFRIMQVADVQEGAKVSPDTIRLLTKAIEREKPDLAVFTGDQLYGIHPSFYFGDKIKNAERTMKEIISPFEKAGIPFAVTFGNHDCQVGLSNAEQADFYGSSPFYVGGDFADENDKGTYRVPLFDDGRHIFDIFLIDSNGQTPSGEYLPVSEKQLDWFISEREKAKEDGEYTKGIVFQHIPVPEFFNVLKPVRFGTKGAVEAFRTMKGKFFILPEEIRNNGGFMGESPAIPDRNSGEFSVLSEKGNILALAVGHDHINSFVAPYKNMKLIYTQCAGFNVYGPKKKRGVRMFELDKNDLSDFRTYTVTYEELTDEKLSAPVGEFILTHIPTSMEQVKRLAVIAAAGGCAVLGTAAAVYFSMHKRIK